MRCRNCGQLQSQPALACSQCGHPLSDPTVGTAPGRRPASRTITWLIAGVALVLAAGAMLVVLAGGLAAWFWIRAAEPEDVEALDSESREDLDAPVQQPAPELTGPVRVTWTVQSRSENCFFFSGPLDLGRNDHLGSEAIWAEHAGRVTLSFGDHVFEGARSGSAVELKRASQHQYQGPWRADESLAVAQQGATAAGRYEYHECNLGDEAECPGRCTIVAKILIAPQSAAATDLL